MKYRSTLASVFEAAERVLAQYQLSAHDLLEQTGYVTSDPYDFEARVPIHVARQFWELATTATRNPCIGFELGKAVRPANLTVLGYAWASSATLHQGMRRLARYHRVLSTGIELSLAESQDEIALSVTLLPGTPTQGRDALMTSLVALCRDVIDPGFAPARVQISGPIPDCHEDLAEYFGCPVEFGAAKDEIAVSTDVADAPLPRPNATIARLSDEATQEYLASIDRDDVVSRTKAAIQELLPEGEPSKDSVASRLNVSSRTLARRLAEFETSYRQLLDGVRRELGIAYMAESRRSVIEIAFLLGFADQSNFTRAFKRWSGQTPTEYRASLG